MISPPSIDSTAEERVISQKISSSHLGSNLLSFNEEEKMCLTQKKKKTNVFINDAILFLAARYPGETRFLLFFLN